MALPDLNWPADLFTDAIIPIPETVAVFAGPGAMRPTLWQAMMEAWVAKQTPSESRWHTARREPAQFVS